MKSLVKTSVLAAVLGAGFVSFSLSANATAVAVDTYLADVSGQTASIDMSVSGNTLTIKFSNTTGSSGPTGANGLLTGLAFDLPNTFDILLTGSGAVVGTGSFIRGGSLNGSGAGTSVQGEWGFQNSVSGHFNGLAVDTQVSTMEADTATKFGASIDNPDVLAGPEYGIMGAGGDRGGLTAVENSLVITLKLSQSVAAGGEAEFIAAIDRGQVAVTFGSPTGSSVPDGGTTLALMGIAIGSIGLIRRKIK